MSQLHPTRSGRDGRRQLICRIASHASQLAADVDELSRFRTEPDALVQQGRTLIKRVERVTGHLNDATELKVVEALFEELMNYMSDVLARARFSRLFFDRMAHNLDQVRALVRPTARAYNDLKHANAILEVLARPASNHVREQIELHSAAWDSAELGELDTDVAYVGET